MNPEVMIKDYNLTCYTCYLMIQNGDNIEKGNYRFELKEIGIK